MSPGEDQPIGWYTENKEWMFWDEEEAQELLAHCSPRETQVALLIRLEHRDFEIGKILQLSRGRIGQVRRKIGKRAEKLLSEKRFLKVVK